MNISIADTKVWENVTFIDNKCTSHKGTLHFRYTDVAAVFILIKENCSDEFLKSPELYQSDPTLPPVREYPDAFVIDLLYYSDYSFIKEPPLLCFHDPVQEFGISLSFQDIAYSEEAKTFLRQFLTTETPNLPGFFKIVRFIPPFAPPARQHRLSSCTLTPVSSITYAEFMNVILVFQQAITPRKSDDGFRPVAMPIKDIKDINEVREAMRTSSVQKEFQLRSWATLLHVFQPDDVDKELVKRYRDTRDQWANMTNSQLLRSKTFCDLVNQLSHNINLVTVPDFFDKELHGFIKKTAFNVLMSITEIDRQYNEWTHPLIDILFVLLEAGQVVVRDGKIFVCDNVEMERDDFEAMMFWMMVKLILRGELFRILPLVKSNKTLIVEPITQFLSKATPSLYEMTALKLSLPVESIPFIAGLATGVLPLDQVKELWSAALSARSVHDFFLCFIICGLVFSGYKLRSDEDTEDEDEVFNTMDLVSSAIKENGLDFIIAATLLLTKKSRKVLGTDVFV